jgi:hypothetical protein
MRKSVGLKSNRAFDAGGSIAVISVAADVKYRHITVEI